jgi:hypothetical protein
MNSNSDSSLHNESIVSQFTKQAIPFTRLSEHSDQYGHYTLVYQIFHKISKLIK